jgi:hypothetical protein
MLKGIRLNTPINVTLCAHAEQKYVKLSAKLTINVQMVACLAIILGSSCLRPKMSIGVVHRFNNLPD